MTRPSASPTPPSPSSVATDEQADVDRPRVFYGWWIVAITVAGTFLATGIHDTAFSVLLKPISADLGWSRTQISLPLTIAIWIAALLGPLVGRILDTRGPRVLTTTGTLIVGAVFFLLSVMTQFWFFFLVYPIGRITTASVLVGGAPSTVVSKWFVRKRGRALGIQAMGLGLGGSAMALIAHYMIAHWGWRSFFVLGGACIWLLAIPAALILRRRPEDIGLLPDGDVAASSPAAPAPQHGHGRARVHRTSHDFTTRDALRTRALWALVIISFIASTGTGALNLHLDAYLTDNGLSAGFAASVVSITAFVGAVGSLCWGVLGERVAPHHGLVVVYVTAAVSVLVIVLSGSAAAALAFALLYGFMGRGGRVLLAVATADYYGRTNLGTIQGIIFPIQSVGMGVGQLVAPMIQANMGSYRPGFLVLALLYVVAAVVGGAMRPPAAPASAEPALLG